MTTKLKIQLLLSVTMLFLLSCDKNSQGNHEKTFHWVAMDEAQRGTMSDGKKLLINVYTEWCEFCKKMDDTVFSDSLVLSSMAALYHSVKLDADSESMVYFQQEYISEKELATRLGINTYPTILFYDPSGDLILQINGYMPSEDFNKMLLYIGEEVYQRTDFHEFAAGRTEDSRTQR
jgi:thioredoxin-related protein